MGILCKIFGHKPEWKSEYQLAYYDPEPTHYLTCARCKCHLHPATFKQYTPRYIGRIW